MAGDCIRAGCYDACEAPDADPPEHVDPGSVIVMEQDIFVTGLNVNDVTSEGGFSDLVREIVNMYNDVLKEWVTVTAFEAVETANSDMPELKVTYRIRVPSEGREEEDATKSAGTASAIEQAMASAAKGGFNTNMVRAFMQMKGGCEVGVTVSALRRRTIAANVTGNDDDDVNDDSVSEVSHASSARPAALLAVALVVWISLID
jgi:hypothetical protein